MFFPSKHTRYLPHAVAFGGSQQNLNGLSKHSPSVYDGLFLARGGKAALALKEWSVAYISCAILDAGTDEYRPEQEDMPLPRHAISWKKLSQSANASGSFAESLRVFALLGKGDEVAGLEYESGDDEESLDLVKGTGMIHSPELSLY